MLKVENLTKIYGDKRAVDNISFTLPEGRAIGFVGPNGAGKSTTMNMITGYIEATSGKIALDDIDVSEKPIEYKSKIGYLPEIPPLYVDMTIMEYLSFVSSIKLPKGADTETECKRVMKLTGIEQVSGRLIRNMSKGYRQRIGLAQAIIGSPKLIILDEPTIGLDPAQVIEFRNLLYKLKKDHTILLSSHILSEITEICDEILMLNEGRLIASGTAEELLAKATAKSEKGILETNADKKTVEEAVKSIDGMMGIKHLGYSSGSVGRYAYEFQIGKKVNGTIVKNLVERGWNVERIETKTANLEDVFMMLTDNTKKGKRKK